MDLMTVITAIPGVGPALPYIAALVVLCAAVAPFLKAPAAGSTGFYATLYTAVNFVALNFGHAKNATAPGAVPAIKAPVALALLLAVAMGLSACAQTQPLVTQTMTDAGVPAATAQTITADAAALGQLMCAANGMWVAPTGANVVNATATAVAQACAIAAPGSVPGAPPTGTLAKVVTVGNDVLALLNASKVVASAVK